MMARCYNPKEPGYESYGAKGIKVCERWHDFANFYADMHPRPEGKSLDRYPNGAGDYGPDNCRWATSREQIINRCVTRWITFNGETLCMRDWAYRFNLRYSTLKTRIGKGYSIEQALTMPAALSNGTKMKKFRDCCKQGHLYANHGYVNSRNQRVCRMCTSIRYRALHVGGYSETTRDAHE